MNKNLAQTVDVLGGSTKDWTKMSQSYVGWGDSPAGKASGWFGAARHASSVQRTSAPEHFR